MTATDKNYDIDHHTLRFLVGLMAFGLPTLTLFLHWYLTGEWLTSISQSYHEDAWSRNIFVGFLFAISAFLMSYNGDPDYPIQKWLSKCASIAALGIAMFPCSCNKSNAEITPNIHYFSAAVMFMVLAMFCYYFFKSAKSKPTQESKYRVTIYLACLLAILLSVFLLILDAALTRFWPQFSIREIFKGLVFWGETVSLYAFAIAWLTASLSIPLITNKSEKVKLFASAKPATNTKGQDEN